MNLNKVQSIGEKIQRIIEKHGWRLYDTEGLYMEFSSDDVWPHTWKQMSKKGFAKKFKMDHTYLFVPIPKKNQTLREAYSATMYINRYGRLIKFSDRGIGPSLLIKNRRDKKRWLFIQRTVFLAPKDLITFSHISFSKEYVIVWTNIPRRDQMDYVEIPYDTVVDTFRRYFKIIIPEGFEKGQKEAIMKSGRTLLAGANAHFKMFHS